MNVSTLTTFILSPILLSLSACQIPYLVSGAVEQARILNSRKKVEKAIQNVAEKKKNKLLYSQKALAFAVDQGLECKDNFKTYVELDRPYVSYLVVASRKNEIRAKTWSFPFVGSFPYKGYFSEAKAKKAIQNLEQKNWDTYLRGVTAYSSLGWFDEPILSSMLNYDQEDLAETIFHECFHRSFFIKNNTELNEQLAVFFAHHIQMLFLKEQNQSEKIENKKLSWEEEKLFSQFLEKIIHEAQDHYKKTADREALFEKIQTQYRTELKPQVTVNNYDAVFLKNLNNAKLAALNTYFYNFAGLEERLQKRFSGDILKFLETLKHMKKKEALKFLKEE